ncbi:hypothetical protein GH714_035453 [Hevea brasiliensis]|uniref:Uncharacterized protein n=1 Tax=Hevea brasiliensis TaxID=3981 RepID=A0A6A6KDC4_HEVBR|nr:hypothetical protein GH714_035453 [Hevea brasiliensis]
MEEIKSFESQQMMSTFQHEASRDNEMKPMDSHFQQVNDEGIVTEQSNNMKILEMLDALIITEGATLERLVVMRFLIAVTVIMRQRLVISLPLLYYGIIYQFVCVAFYNNKDPAWL